MKDEVLYDKQKKTLTLLEKKFSTLFGRKIWTKSN